MAGRLNPGLLRGAMRVAITDDLFNGQPELEYRDLNRQAADGVSIYKVYEVRGFIDPNRLGTFGAQQLEQVIERCHPGLMSSLNGQHTEITEADIMAILERIALPGEPYNADIAKAVVALVRERTTYTPSFDDV